MAPKVVRLRPAAAGGGAGGGWRWRLPKRPRSAADGAGGGNHGQSTNVVCYQLNFDDLFRDGVFRMQCFRCPIDECKAPVFIPDWWDMRCQDMMVPCWKCGCFLGRVPVCEVDIVRR